MNQPPNIRQEHQQELDLNLYIRALIRSRAAIFKSVSVALSLALLYLFLATPQYASNVLLQLVPSEAYPASIDNSLPPLDPANDAVLAGIEILTSRRVVGRVVDRLHLDIISEPEYFPIIGAPLARIFNLFDDDPSDLRSPLLGMKSYAWGGEEIVVDQFDVPAYFEDEDFDLVTGEQGTFQLLDEEESVIIEGTVGQLSRGSITMPNGSKEEISILVSKLVGHTGSGFLVNKIPWMIAVAEYQEILIAEEVSVNSGIIDLSLEGPDPVEIARVLDTVVQIYLNENVLKKLDELDRILVFVNGQLPEVKASLQLAQAELSQYYEEYGGVDITMETSTLLAQLEEVQELISAIELLRIDYVRSYTQEHPILTSLEDKSKQLQARKDAITAELAELPVSEIVEINVERNVEIASEIYLALLQMQQELSIAKAGVGSNVWIIDDASIPIEISSPYYLLIPLLAVFTGGFIGTVGVLFRRRNVEVIESPNALDSLGMLVISIRHSPGQRKIDRLIARNKAPAAHFLSEFAPLDIAVEGLRDLHNSLLLSDTTLGSNPLLLCTAVPDSGGSFIMINLMHLLAESGKSVVVIDADVRGGHIHKSVGKRRAPGLSDVVLDNFDLNEALQTLAVSHYGESTGTQMAILGAGRQLDDSTQVFMAAGFAQAVNSLKRQFDIVLIHTPPVIGSTDALVITKFVEGNCLMVIRAGQLTREEIDLAIRRFTQEGNKFHGVVLNDVPAGLGYGY